MAAAADDKKAKHTVFLDKRESISVTGVLDVISFDEEVVVVDTAMGVLVLRGVRLHVNRLSLESGELSLDGELNSLTYEDASNFNKGRPAFLGKLFK